MNKITASQANSQATKFNTDRDRNEKKANDLLARLYACIQEESSKGDFSALIDLARSEIINEDVYLGLEDIGEISDLCVSPAGRLAIKSLQLDGFKVTVNYEGGPHIDFCINW
jgi:hypothetical protein